MTSGSYTIGGTTPDYATVTAWEADITGNLTGIVEGKVRAGTYEGNFVLDANSYTTTSSFYMKLTYDTGAFHAGVFGGGVVFDPADTEIEHVFNTSAAYTRFVGLEVKGWQGISSEAFRIGATGIRIEQCIMHDAGDINADAIHVGASGYTTYISNCLFFALGRSAFLVQGDVTGTVYINNCTGLYGHGQSSCVFGCDTANGPLTSYTFHIKNTYGHIMEQWGSVDQLEVFEKTAAADWGNSTHNASNDASASNLNGTYYQNNADPADNLVQALLMYYVGENTTDDYSGSWEDTWIDLSNQTTNHATDTGTDIDNARRDMLLRVKLDLVPTATRVKVATLDYYINDVNQAQYKAHKCLRNWVEGEATWLLWSTGNSWTTAGALSDGNDVDLDSLNAEGGRCYTLSAFYAAGDWFRLCPGPLFREYVQSAVDGASGDPKGDDWINMVSGYHAGTTGIQSYNSSEHGTDGLLPILELWYDTASAPFDPVPAVGGVLDANGTDLSSDAYPITVDIQGATRDATWDIGAYLFGPPQTATGTLVTQAGVGYDGVLDPGAAPLVQAAAADIAGVGYDGVVQGADFISPIIHIAGGWTGEATDIDESLPPVDADYIASVASPSRISLISNGDMETAWAAGDWLGSDAGWSRYASGSAHSGSYVARADSSASIWLKWGTDILLDPAYAYELRFWYRKLSGTRSDMYGAIASFRANGSMVRIDELQSMRGAHTYLTAAAVSADTVLTVASTANWVDAIASMAVWKIGGHPPYFDDSDLGEEFKDDWLNSINLHDTTVVAGPTTLNCKTTVGRDLPVGTLIRQHRSGGYLPYPCSDGSIVTGTTWLEAVGRIGPRIASRYDSYWGENLAQNRHFRFGTVNIAPWIDMNYGASDPTISEVDDVTFHRLDNVTYVPLKPTLDPQASDRHHVRYRYSKDIALGTVNLKVRLLVEQNVYNPASPGNRSEWYFTEIASWQHNDISATPATVKQTLSSGEADAMLWGNEYKVWLEFEATS